MIILICLLHIRHKIYIIYFADNTSHVVAHSGKRQKNDHECTDYASEDTQFKSIIFTYLKLLKYVFIARKLLNVRKFKVGNKSNLAYEYFKNRKKVSCSR